MNIKKLLPLVGLPVFVVVIVFVTQTNELQRSSDAAELVRSENARAAASVSSQWRTDVDAVLADTVLWQVLTPPRTADASAFLTPFIEWDGTEATGMTPPSSSLPPLSSGTIDAVYAQGFFKRTISFTHIDVSWMKALPNYTHFDLEAPSPWATFDKARSVRHAPQPSSRDLFEWARLRLAKGLADGDVTTASREVRALAAIVWSCERQTMNELASIIVADDAFVRGIARERGLVVEGPDIPTAMVFEKVIRSAPFLFDVLTPLSVQSFERSDARFCGALTTNASLILLDRAAFQAAFPDRVAAIGNSLETSPCVLARLRRQWRDGGGEEGIDLPPPPWLIAKIPPLMKRWLVEELTLMAGNERTNTDLTWFPTGR